MIYELWFVRKCYKVFANKKNILNSEIQKKVQRLVYLMFKTKTNCIIKDILFLSLF